MKQPSKRLALALFGSLFSAALLVYNIFSYYPHKSIPEQNKDEFAMLLSLLQLHHFSTNKITTNHLFHHLTFELTSPNTKDTITIRLTSQKNPYYQVQSLQNTIRTANIKGTTIKFIDLAAKHPYATLKNY